jgi:hypothetical protein
MMATRGRPGEGPETTGRDHTRRDETAITILAGPTATATIEDAIAGSRIHSSGSDAR